MSKKQISSYYSSSASFLLLFYFFLFLFYWYTNGTLLTFIFSIVPKEKASSSLFLFAVSFPPHCIPILPHHNSTPSLIDLFILSSTLVSSNNIFQRISNGRVISSIHVTFLCKKFVPAPPAFHKFTHCGNFSFKSSLKITLCPLWQP